MTEFQQIKDQINMEDVCSVVGVTFNANGRTRCPIHDGDNPEAFRLMPDKQRYVCATKGCTGDIFDFVQAIEGVSRNETVEWFKNNLPRLSLDSKKPPKTGGQSKLRPRRKRKATQKPSVVYYESEPSFVWVYRDAAGHPLFEVKRFNEQNGGKKKKTLPYTDGRPGMDDSNRVLYNLDKITANFEAPIIIVEGEKAAQAVTDLGFIGTTNSMGCHAWQPKFNYAESLRDRDVLIIPDADDEGQDWLKDVLADIRGKVKSAQVAQIPKKFVRSNKDIKGHDIADILEIEGKESATEFILKSRGKEPVMIRGVEAGVIYTPDLAFDSAKKMILEDDFEVINFSHWIPGLNVSCHRSDLVVLMANTGTGKTRLVHNIPFHYRDKNYLIFDLELSSEVLGLRYASMATGLSKERIYHMIKNGYEVPKMNLDHIFLDNSGGIDLQHVRDKCKLIEDVTQREIEVVAIDYIGLMKKTGNSRYADLSAHVEAFKGFLNETNKVGIITTQVSRPFNKEEGYFECPSVFDAKDSGSVENSAQLLLMAWRQSAEDRSALGMRVGKWSHGEVPERDFNLVAKGLRIESSSFDWSKINRHKQQEMI